MGPFLIIPDEGGRRQSLDGKPYWRIGRGGDNDIVIDNQWISRHHAMFQKLDSGSVYLIDLGSRNGSQINGQRVVAPAMLRDGDRLTLGRVAVEFYSPDSPAQDASDLLNNVSQATYVDPAITAASRERRLVSIVVVDIRGFTTLARKLDNHVLSEMIAAFHSRVQEVLRKHGSWGGKSTGDGQMAVWAHDETDSSDNSLQVLQSEQEAAHAAGRGSGGRPDRRSIQLFTAVLAIADLTDALHLEFPLPGPVRIGAGVNTGYAVVESAAIGGQPDYTVLGDAVNAAFRLESATRQIGTDLIIGQSTYDRLFPMAHGAGLSTPLVVQPPFMRHVVQLKG